MYHTVSYVYRVFWFVLCICPVFINSCSRFKKKRTNKNVLKQKDENKEVPACLRRKAEVYTFRETAY